MANEFRIKKGLIVNETDLYVSGSEVGIGTASPTHTLDVLGNNTVAIFRNTDGSGADTGIAIRGARNGTVDGVTTYIDFLNNDNNSGGEHYLGRIYGSMASTGGNDGTLTLQTYNGSSFVTGLNIDENGNIGVKTTTPSSTLHVNGPDTNNHTPTVYFKNNGANAGEGDVLDVETARGDGASDSYIARFRNSASTKLYIQGDGNIGIGTESPTVPLQVAGNISGSGNLNIDGTATVDGVLNVNSYIYIDRADERMIVMEDSGGDNTGYLTMNDSQGNMQLMLGVDGDGHYVVTGDGAAKLLYSAHGQDGILSMNAGQQGTANQDVVFTIGISADSNDNTIKVGASNDNVGLDVGEGNTVFDASGNLYTENIYARNANGLNILDDSGTLGIFVKDGGNVGIGTDSLPRPLTVEGSVSASGNVQVGSGHSANAYGRLQVNQSSNVDEEGIGILSSGFGRSMRIWVDETNSYISSGDGGNGVLVLNEGTGNVGIGTPNPAVQLHISGSNSTFAQVRVEAGADGYDSSVAYSQAGTIKGISGYDDSTDTVAIKYGTFGGNGIDIDSSGNVGIGTTSPEGPLHIKKTTTTSVIIENTDDNGNDDDLVIKNTNDRDVGIKFETGGGFHHLMQDSAGDDSLFISAGGRDAADITMEFYQNHNVEIPNGNLTVSGDVTVSGKVTAEEFHTEFVSASIIYQSGSTKFGDTSDDVHAFSGSLRVTGSGDHYFSDGNVGIGTTSPDNKLHVDSGTVNIVAKFISSDDTAQIQISDNDTTTYFGSKNGLSYISQTGGTPADGLCIDSSGDVGIGTTSPSTKLHVEGNISGSGTLTVQGDVTVAKGDTSGKQTYHDLYIGGTGLGSTDSAIYIGNQGDGTGYGWELFYSGSGSGNENKLVFISENLGSPNNVMTMLQDGNVGIGTTSPTEKLEVTGNAILDASNANLKIKAGVTGTKGDIQWTFNTDSTVYASAGIEYNNRGTDGFLIDSGYPITMDFASSYIRWRHNGSEKMRLDTNGNLGLGLTSPSDGDLTINTPRLHVLGPGTSGVYNLVARFQGGGDADNTGASILINHSNDRGLLIKAGRKDSDREVAYFDLVSSGATVTNMLSMGKYGSDYNVGIGTTTPSQKLTVAGTISGSSDLSIDGNSVFDGTVGYNTFNSGFGGNGWRIDSNANAEFENLTVRGTFSVYELLAQQIRATNGSLLVATSGKVDTVTGTTTGTLTFDTGNVYGHGFLANDIILAQRLDTGGTSLKRTFLRVDSRVDSGSLTYTKLSGDNPEAGQEFVRIGNTTDTDRQGHIYLTADDNFAPYIGVRDGVNAYTDFTSGTGSVEKVRVGRLDGVTSANFGSLSGYGLWASGSVYLEGGISATFGDIGGFGISQTTISSSNNNLILRDDGQITGSTVLFDGGKIGGFNITSDKLSITSGDFEILQGSLFSNNIGYRVVETTGGSRQINMRYDTADDSLEFLIYKDSNNYFNVGDAYANQYTGWGLNLHVAGEDILKVENDIVTLSGFTATKDAFAGGNFYISGSATGNEFFISSSNFNVKANGDVTGSSVLFTGGRIGDEYQNITFDPTGNITLNNVELKVSDTTGLRSDIYDGANSKRVVLQDNTIAYTTFEDDTLITIIGTDGAIKSTITVDTKYTEGTISAADIAVGDIIDSDKPVSLVNTGGGHAVLPFSFLSKTFLLYVNRYYTRTIRVFSPFGDATVSASFDGTNDGTFNDGVAATIAPQNTATDINASDIISGTWPTSGNNYFKIESDFPILAFNDGPTGDYVSLYPLSKEILHADEGVPIKLNSTTSTTHQGGGYYTGNTPFQVQNIGDGAGGDSEQGMPLQGLGDTYIIPHSVNGYEIVSVEPNIVKAYTLTAGTKTLSNTVDHSAASKTNPLNATVGSNDSGGSGIHTGAMLFEGTAPFALRTQDPQDDEYHVIGYRRTQRQAYDNSTTIKGDRIRTGKIQSNNWNDSTAGSLIDLNLGTAHLGGSGSNASFYFDGTDLFLTGSINATSGNFTGTISAGDGDIGGFNIGTNTLTTTNFSIGDSTQTYALAAGASNQFTVTHAGALTATSATITGDITATNITATTAGNIAGWSIGANTLSSGDVYLSNVTNEKGLYIGDGLGAPYRFQVGEFNTITPTSTTITQGSPSANDTGTKLFVSAFPKAFGFDTTGASADTGNIDIALNSSVATNDTVNLSQPVNFEYLYSDGSIASITSFATVELQIISASVVVASDSVTRSSVYPSSKTLAVQYYNSGSTLSSGALTARVTYSSQYNRTTDPGNLTEVRLGTLTATKDEALVSITNNQALFYQGPGRKFEWTPQGIVFEGGEVTIQNLTSEGIELTGSGSLNLDVGSIDIGLGNLTMGVSKLATSGKYIVADTNGNTDDFTLQISSATSQQILLNQYPVGSYNIGIDGSPGSPEFFIEKNETDEVFRIDTNKNIEVQGNFYANSGNITGSNFQVGEYISHIGDTNTFIRFQTDDISLTAAGNNLFRVDNTAPVREIVVNEAGAATNFRVESDTVTDALFVTASNGYVGIGTTSPEQTLDVDGTVRIQSTGAATLILDGDTNNSGDSGETDSIIDMRHDAGTYGMRLSARNFSGKSAFRIQENRNGSYSERFYIDEDGDVGIGTITPSSKLDVAGDITTSGNLIVASGQGIDFSATGDAGGMTSELLDDYEEGTWTPAYKGRSGSTIYNPTAGSTSNTSATYTKIGNKVFFSCYMRSSGITFASTGYTLVVDNLPFVCGEYTSVGISYADQFAGDYPAGGYVENGQDYIVLTYRNTSDGDIFGMNTGDLSNGTDVNDIMIAGFYTI